MRLKRIWHNSNKNSNSFQQPQQLLAGSEKNQVSSNKNNSELGGAEEVESQEVEGSINNSLEEGQNCNFTHLTLMAQGLVPCQIQFHLPSYVTDPVISG